MATNLLEIRPQELKFTFEVKKQSSCSVQLTNNSQHYVAFKVKTTSPKKYCVRPNVGIVPPESVSDFTVTMQALRVAPPDLICKDKFLIQSTVVPVGTREEDIASNMFDRDGGKYVEQSKMKVVLMSAPLTDPSPANGIQNLLPAYEASPVKIPASNDLAESKLSGEIKEPKLVETNPKLETLELKLCEAEATISRLTEERKANVQRMAVLLQELDVLRRSRGVPRVQVGFPFLFVGMVAAVSLVLGCLLKT